MAKESYYQSNIMRAIINMGGVAINGRYTKNGEADLQCGYPYEGRLYYLAVEVKTEKDYHRVISGITKGYKVKDIKKLKPHEPLQMSKIRSTRKKGGLALVAYNIEQVVEYVNDTLKEKNVQKKKA